jgi:hypothetical protein
MCKALGFILNPIPRKTNKKACDGNDVLEYVLKSAKLLFQWKGLLLKTNFSHDYLGVRRPPGRPNSRKAPEPGFLPTGTGFEFSFLC